MRCLVLSLVLTFGGLLPHASADTPALPRPYKTVVGQSDEYVFVMMPGTPSGAKYPASGLYRNDGSTTPLWTVEWYAFGTHVSDDGQHLVRMGPWASGPEQLAVAFYAEGRLTKAYRIVDLVADVDALPHSVSHFFWRRKVQFDEAENRLALSTLTGEAYLFDVATGQILRAERLELPAFGATVEKTDGSRLRLTRFETCAGPMFSHKMITAGRRARVAFYGDKPKPGVVDDGEYASYTIPFSEISFARRLRARDIFTGIWLVQKRDKSTLELVISEDHVGFCGKTREGDDASFSARKLTRITLEPTAGKSQ